MSSGWFILFIHINDLVAGTEVIYRMFYKANEEEEEVPQGGFIYQRFSGLSAG